MAIEQPNDQNNNPAAPAKLRKAERQIMALTLRKQGASYRKIASELRKQAGVSDKYSEAQAYRDCMASLHELVLTKQELAKENLRLDLERLDDLFIKPFEAAKKGDLMALNSCLSILDRRARLLNYDHSTPTSLNIDLTKLSDTQLERIANGEDPIVVLATQGAD